MIMTDRYIPDVRPSAEQVGWSHRVAVYYFERPTGDSAIGDKVIMPMSIDEAEALQEKLALAIRSARKRQLSDALRGDCETCRGTRMVDVERNGSISKQGAHCLDCLPADLVEYGLPPEAREVLS